VIVGTELILTPDNDTGSELEFEGALLVEWEFETEMLAVPLSEAAIDPETDPDPETVPEIESEVVIDIEGDEVGLEQYFKILLLL